jgi:hypothetical protein
MWFRKKKKSQDNQSSIETDKEEIIYIRGSRVSIRELFNREYGIDRFSALCENVTLGEFYNLISASLDLLEKEVEIQENGIKVSKFVSQNFSSFYSFLAQSSRHAMEAADNHRGIDIHNRERLESLSYMLYSFFKAMMSINSNKQQNELYQKAYKSLTDIHDEYGFRTGVIWEITHSTDDRWKKCFLDENEALS